MNAAPGSRSASRPASHRSTVAPTSASGPSWRAPAAGRRAARRAQHLAGRGQQRRVLARVIGLPGEPDRTPWSAVMISRSLGVQPGQQAREVGVDLAQGAIEAAHVLAMAVDLVGLDQVGEHEPPLELAEQRLDALQRLRVRGAGVRLGDADAREQI